MTDPDSCCQSLLGFAPDPTRYNTENCDPDESTALVASLIKEGARVLDVGCGIGAIGEYVQRTRKAIVYGVEPNADRARQAESRGLKVINGLLNPKLIAELGSFDAIILADVLEHLADPGEMLALVKSAIKSDGKLVISVPNAAHWSVRWELFRGRFDYQPTGLFDATHLRWFTRSSLKAILARSGFQVDSEQFSSGLTLSCYENRRLFRLINQKNLRSTLRYLKRWWPELFCCQYIIRCTH
jgi:methionine biosynthesis protein MetW